MSDVTMPGLGLSRMESWRPSEDLWPLPRASGKWHKHMHLVSVPPSGSLPDTEVSQAWSFFHKKECGAITATCVPGFRPNAVTAEGPRRPEPTLPVAPQHQELSQQLNKVSFICDIQIQPMQKEIFFSFDSSDNKLLKKKIYIKEFIFKVSSKRTIKG